MKKGKHVVPGSQVKKEVVIILYPELGWMASYTEFVSTISDKCSYLTNLM